MAQESLQSARVLLGNGSARPAASRTYYAGYQAATAMLHQNGGLMPPTINGVQREGWGHEQTPDLLVDHSSNLPLRRRKSEMSSKLKTLYRLRISSDYISRDKVAVADVSEAISMAGQIVKAAEICVLSGGVA